MSIQFLEPRHEELAARAAEWAKTVNLQVAPAEVVKALGQAGWLRACVPSEFGGLRSKVELRDLCALRDQLGYVSPLGDTLFAMQGLGSYPVTLFGSAAQKKALLPRVHTGAALCAFAVTEPNAGSDVSGIATSARRTNDGWVLDGEKRFISNAGIAHSYVVFARTSAERKHGLSAFLVEGGSAGMSTEPLELIAPHPIGTVRFNDCKLPAGALLGEVGQGFEIAMTTLDFFRTSVGAAALGMARRAFDETVSRVKTRQQFGKPLADFQGTQMAIADMTADIAASRLLVYAAAHRIDRAGPSSLDAALAKLYATEAAQRVIDRAVQLHGGEGLIAGHIVERLYRDVRALRIYEGTSEIQKLVIARQVLS